MGNPRGAVTPILIWAAPRAEIDFVRLAGSIPAMIDFVGKPGEERKSAKAEAKEEAKVEKKPKAPKEAAEKKPAAKKAPAKKK